jgi:hypothetical protein
MRKVFLLRRMLENDISNIPFYLDTKKYSHRVIWDKYQMIIQHLSKLTDNKFIKERCIKGIVSDVNEQLDIIILLDSSDITLIIISDIIGKINDYIDQSLEYELYEISNNLTIFLSHFSKNPSVSLFM